MANPAGDIAPPSALLLALEPRGLFSFARLIAAAPFLATAPRGAPQAVIVLPGLGATDRSTAAIRAYLKFLGYEAHGLSRGRNVRPAGADKSRRPNPSRSRMTTSRRNRPSAVR